MERKIMTLETFDNTEHLQEDGYYAAWVSGKVYTDEQVLWGFSGEIVKYTYQDGWSYVGDWFDEKDAREINLVFLERLPESDEIGRL